LNVFRNHQRDVLVLVSSTSLVVIAQVGVLRNSSTLFLILIQGGTLHHCPNSNCSRVYTLKDNLRRHLRYELENKEFGKIGVGIKLNWIIFRCECNKSPRFTCRRACGYKTTYKWYLGKHEAACQGRSNNRRNSKS